MAAKKPVAKKTGHKKTSEKLAKKIKAQPRRVTLQEAAEGFAKPAVAAMVKQENAQPEVLTVGGVPHTIRAALGLLSTYIPAMSVPELAQMDAQLRPLEKGFAACHKLVKERLAATVREIGRPFNENGSLEAHIPGYRLQAWRTAPKLDDKKVLQLVGGKGLLHEEVANPVTEIHWVVDEAKLVKLLSDGKISQEELDSCKTNERWVLQEPKPVTEVEE